MWFEAPELTAVITRLVETVHHRLEGTPIRAVFRDYARRIGGSPQAATAEVVRGRFAHFVMTEEEKALSPDDQPPMMSWIEVAYEVWESLTDAQAIALIDHELTHCEVFENEESGQITFSIRPHDIEEFTEIISRHGQWSKDLERFFKASETRQGAK